MLRISFCSGMGRYWQNSKCKCLHIFSLAVYYVGRERGGGTIPPHCRLWGPLLSKTESSLVVVLTHMTDKLFCYKLKRIRARIPPKLCRSLCGFLLRLLLFLPFAVSQDGFLLEMLQRWRGLLLCSLELLIFFLRFSFVFPLLSAYICFAVCFAYLCVCFVETVSWLHSPSWPET